MGSNGVMLLIIIICVILSGYFSATETAFSAINRVRIRNQAEKGTAILAVSHDRTFAYGCNQLITL